jgi:hypothetical protein
VRTSAIRVRSSEGNAGLTTHDETRLIQSRKLKPLVHPRKHPGPNPPPHAPSLDRIYPPRARGDMREVPPFPGQVSIAKHEPVSRFEGLIELVRLEEGVWEEEGKGSDCECENEGGRDHLIP